MSDESITHAKSDASSGLAHWKGSDRYEVLGCLGRGGMGIVYDVFDRHRHERVALKTLLHFDAAGLYRFKKEFRSLADVLHPNLVHLHELATVESDEVLFTMELVEGTDFIEHVHKVGTLRAHDQTGVVTVDTAIRKVKKTRGETAPSVESDRAPSGDSPADFDKLRPALRQLVEGVRALHGAGMLHRDLKPSNVRVTPDGRVVILDFGVATELRRRAPTASGQPEEVVGTVTYMAPEQASGDAPVTASDWYSVGALLYEALVGRPPFSGTAIDVLTLKYTVDPAAPSACVHGVPEDLNALCIALLGPDPETRPGGAEILRRLGVTPSDRAPAPRVQDGSEATHFVGREAHVLALREAFEATRAGGSVAVRVGGLSGLGKSALVHHFLDELERPGDVLVLRGRAYQRESVPYKAVDGIIDALSRHLMDLQARSEPLALPREIAALAHVFPVLRRVESIEDLPAAPAGDPQIVRQRAFGVLRELFSSLSERQPVVVFIDDVQWGDTDSAALLVELMRPPATPPLLLVTTHRAEEADTSPFLADLRARWPEDAEVRELTVGPLELADARRLALALLGSEDGSAARTADEIAGESGGSPFLLEELARGASAYHRIAMGEQLLARPAVTLDQMLAERAMRLPDDARRLLEVIAVGGRPLPVTTVGSAAGADESATQLVALLRARRFVRVGLREGREVVESSHDRIREAIVAHLPAEIARAHHAELAKVLEATPDSDPEGIATHLLGAGARERAAHYAERAAEQAVAKLAFAQAARLFQMTLESIGPSSPEVRRIALRTAEACEWAGHAEKAARAYLTAAEGAPALERVDLERAAAAQLIAAGRIDESAEVSRRVLAAVGREVPQSFLGTIFGIVLYRIAARFLMGAKLDDGKKLSPEDSVRLEALHALSRGLAVLDPIAAMYVKARYLVDALRLKNRTHVVRAAASEASSLAAEGGGIGKQERALWDMARSLSENGKDPAGFALYQVTYGICQYLRGQWTSSLEILDEACARLAKVRRWQANANSFAVYALVYRGELREVKSRTARLLADAERRGDLYTTVNLRASHPMMAWLASDDVEGARRHIVDSLGQWSKTRFLVQHWQGMLLETEVELYAGSGSRAWERLSRDAQALKRSHLLSVQLMRILAHFVRGRAALASLEGLPETDRGRRLAGARATQRALEKEGMSWSAPLASLLGASLAKASGDVPGAESALRRAIEQADAAGMQLHASAARHRLGSLLGGEAGEAMLREAEEVMKAQGVRVPEKYTRMLVPWR